MRVVADTTPLNYLLLIDHIDILASLYSQVVMPQAVGAELRDPRAPAIVRAWVTALPPWCVIRPVHGRPDPTVMWLDAGEREALMLMQELGADVLLIDDLDGRREALRRGMQVTGTLGILERAALRALLDLPAAITRLQATTFHLPSEIIAAMLARDADRKSRPPPLTRR